MKTNDKTIHIFKEKDLNLYRIVVFVEKSTNFNYK